jgi:hypothetical protein
MELAVMAASAMGGTAAAGAGGSLLAGSALAGTAVETALASTAASATSSIMGGSILSSLTSGLSMASMAASLFGGMSNGKAQERKAEMEARGMELDAKQTELQGREDANAIMDNMIQTIAAQRLAFSGAGVDPSFGTPRSLADSARNIAEMQLGTSRANTRNGVLARRRNAVATRIDGTNQRVQSTVQGIASAGDKLTTFLSRRQNRG